MSAMSSAVLSLGGEAFGVVRGVIRGLLGRWGTGPILFAAITIASALYGLYRTTPLRPGPARPGTRTRRRGTNPRRPTGLTGVNRVTMGVELNRGLLDSAGGIHSENLVALRKFANLFELYVIVRIESDDAESRVSSAFAEADVRGFDTRKLLFCDTTDGRVSMVREIDPDLHIDEVDSVVSKLQRFIRHVAYVSPPAADGDKALASSAGAASSSSSRKNNILRYNSFSQFF